MAKNPIEGSQRLNKNARARTPLRVAPRMQPAARKAGMKTVRKTGKK